MHALAKPQPHDQLMDLLIAPAFAACNDQRGIIVGGNLRERLDKAGVVLARLHCADGQHERRVGQAVLAAHIIDPGGGGRLEEARRHAGVGHGDALRRSAVQVNHIAPGRLRDRDDAVGTAGRAAHHPAQIVQHAGHGFRRVALEGEVVDGHDRARAGQGGGQREVCRVVKRERPGPQLDGQRCAQPVPEAGMCHLGERRGTVAEAPRRGWQVGTARTRHEQPRLERRVLLGEGVDHAAHIPPDAGLLLDRGGHVDADVCLCHSAVPD